MSDLEDVMASLRARIESRLMEFDHERSPPLTTEVPLDGPDFARSAEQPRSGSQVASTPEHNAARRELFGPTIGGFLQRMASIAGLRGNGPGSNTGA
jgi:hypothetical protein